MIGAELPLSTLQVEEVNSVEAGLMQDAQRFFVLTQTDNLWKEHLQAIKFVQQVCELLQSSLHGCKLVCACQIIVSAPYVLHSAMSAGQNYTETTDASTLIHLIQ